MVNCMEPLITYETSGYENFSRAKSFPLYSFFAGAAFVTGIPDFPQKKEQGPIPALFLNKSPGTRGPGIA